LGLSGPEKGVIQERLVADMPVVGDETHPAGRAEAVRRTSHDEINSGLNL